MAKARGFSSSRMSFPASLGVASSGFRPSRSDTSSTGRHRESLGQNISSSVDIAVVPDAALGADPFAHIQWEIFHNMLAVITGFARGYHRSILMRVRPDHWLLYSSWRTNSPHPTSLMALARAVILDHVLDGQTLHADHLVFVNDACRKLVLVVTSTVMDTSMHMGYFPPCFLPVLGTFFFLGVPTLGFCQSLLILA